MTLDSCTLQCTTIPDKYAGVWGADCYCSNTFNATDMVLVPDGSCNVPCPGDASEICGGTVAETTFAKRQAGGKLLTVYVNNGTASNSTSSSFRQQVQPVWHLQHLQPPPHLSAAPPPPAFSIPSPTAHQHPSPPPPAFSTPSLTAHQHPSPPPLHKQPRTPYPPSTQPQYTPSPPARQLSPTALQKLGN